MAVRRRSDRKGEWWIDFVITLADGTKKRVRKKAPSQTKRDAESHERALRNAILNPPTKKTKKHIHSVKRFSQSFLDDYSRANNKHSEVESKESILKNHLLPFFGRLALDQVKVRNVERYKSCKLSEGLSPKTINNHLTVLRKMLSVACEWEIITQIPRIKWLRTPPPSTDFLTFSEAERLVAYTPEKDQVMILTALRTGLRLGELRALRWVDVDLENGRVVVRQSLTRGRTTTPKSGREREIPLSQETLNALAASKTLGPLVFSRPEGKPWSKDQCNEILWRACKKAELRRIGWHKLRHTFASHLVMRGVPLKVVQELLGHATVEMTMRYAHLSPDVKREAVQVLDLQPCGTSAAPKKKGNPNKWNSLRKSSDPTGN